MKFLLVVPNPDTVGSSLCKHVDWPVTPAREDSIVLESTGKVGRISACRTEPATHWLDDNEIELHLKLHQPREFDRLRELGWSTVV